MNNLSPIVLFVYNRPWHTQQTVEALKKNHLAAQSHLIVFADGVKTPEASKSVEGVRQYIHAIEGFSKVTVIESEKNLGLAQSIISGVTEVVKQYDKIIVLEDDLLTSPYFLQFMNNALEYYKGDDNVLSIGGYTYPQKLFPLSDFYQHDVYFSSRSCSWGWATWKGKWELADWNVTDFDILKKSRKKQKSFNQAGDDMYDMLEKQMSGNLDSWSIRWDYTHFQKEAVCVYPSHSLVNNIGHDGSGVHCDNLKDNRFEVDFDLSKNKYEFIAFKEKNQKIVELEKKIHRWGIKQRVRNYLKKRILRIIGNRSFLNKKYN
jgi:hypothetical protein